MMKTKTIIAMTAMALMGLASCNKNQLSPEKSEEGEYVLEIEGDLTTKGITGVSLNLANLSYSSSANVTAQLKRKSGSNWVNVTEGVVYSWSASSTDSQKFSGSGTVNKTCQVSAKAKGSGTLTVAASLSGTQVASQSITVTVSDSRALSWSSVTTPISSGEVKSAVLNANFSGTVTVGSNNSSFVVGTSSSSLSSTASVSFSSGTTKTIYYKYTGSSAATVSMSASASGVSSASTSISVKSAEPGVLKSLTATPSSSSCYIKDYVPVTYTATYTDGSTKTLSFSDLKDYSFWFVPDEAPTGDYQADVRYCNLTSSGFITSNAEEGSLLNLAGSKTGSSYGVECDVSYTEGGKTVTAEFYMTVKVEVTSLEIGTSGGTTLYASKPQSTVSYYPRFTLKSNSGNTVYFSGTNEAMELVEQYGGYGVILRGNTLNKWDVSVTDCQSAGYTMKEAFSMFVSYPGFTTKYTQVTYDPYN